MTAGASSIAISPKTAHFAISFNILKYSYARVSDSMRTQKFHDFAALWSHRRMRSSNIVARAWPAERRSKFSSGKQPPAVNI